MTNYTNVSARAMLVSLSISTWAGRKFDKRATEKVNTDSGADAEAGRYNKHLLSGAPAHRNVILKAGDARQAHYDQTLPWADEGKRLLPTSNYFTYTEVMRKKRSAFDLALNNFIDEYPALREAAPLKLGRLYKESEFPSTKDVRRRFSWSIDFDPVPSGGDLRLDLPADQISLIEQSVTSRVEQATKDAMRDAWNRLREAVARIQRASGKDGVVRGNLIDHAREVIDVLGRLNVSGDEALDEMRSRVERELTGIVVEDLRKDDRLRADTEKRATDIMAAMSEFYAPPALSEVA